MTYKVEFSPAAKRAFDKLPKDIQRSLAAMIGDLMEQPRPRQSIKMTGHDLYRIRSGDYRLIYRIEDDKLVVLIVTIGHRREVYR